MTLAMDLDPHRLPESLNLTQVFLEAQLPRHGDRPALYFEDQVITYRQLSDRTDRAVAVLRGLGLRMEERVLLLLPDVPQFASAWFGVVKAGGVVAAVSPELRPEEAEYYANYTRARIVIAHAGALPALEAVRHACPHLQHVLVAGGGGDPGRYLSYDAELDRAVPDRACAPTHRDDACAWLFTSGSTGFPKGAVHKQHDFVFSALTYALPVLGYGPKDVCAGSPKLAFGYALGTNLLFPLLAGGAGAIFPEKSTPERLFTAIQKFRPTVLTTVPTSLNAMVNSPEIDRVDFSSLRACISAGEALPAELYGKWKAKTGVEILDGIGSAEMFHIFITNRMGDVKLGSLGKVVEGYQAKICDDDGAELPRGEIGTLWIRGGSMALEYWQQHEKSKQTFRGDWCVSADKFRQDEQGYFSFCGRGDDMLKVGGKW